MILSKSIRGFLLDISSGNYAFSTVALYEIQLRHLCDFLGDPPLESITGEDLKRFMVWLKTDYKPVRKNKSQAPLTGTALDNHWKAIRSFWKWASSALVVPNAAADLPRPQYKNPEITPFTQDEIKRMLQACEKSLPFKRANTKEYQISRPTSLRDKAIILLLLDTGMRVGELCRVKIQDFDQQTGEITITPYSTGRKTKPRTVFLGRTARRIVWLYLAKRGEYLPDDSLIPLTPTPIRQIFRAIEKRSGVKNVHPHRFRHTFAIEYLRNSGDVFTLQRLLGHATLEMVQHYLALARADTAEAHRRASPADRWKL